MENVQTNNGGNGNALVQDATSLLADYNNKMAKLEEERQSYIKKLEVKRDELTAAQQEIEQALSAVGVSVGGGSRRGRKPGRPAKKTVKATRTRSVKATEGEGEGHVGRPLSAETEKAKEKIVNFLRANKEGIGRGEIATKCKIDVALAGRVLQMLSDEGAAKIKGSKRGAKWFPVTH